MTEKDFWRGAWSILTIVILMGVFKLMDIEGGFFKTAVTVLVIVSFFEHRFGATGPRLQKIFTVVSVVLFLLSWGFTGPTARWGLNRAEENAPRDNFDPKKEDPVALARFYEKSDGTIERVGDDWVRNPITGEKLARPGTTEFAEILDRYERQEVRKRLKTADKPAPLRPSVPGNWELYREFDIVLADGEESQEYSIQADAGERRVPTWRTHEGEVDVSFNREAGGTDTPGRFLTPPNKAANGTEFIQFRAKKGGARITLWVWRER